MIEKITSTHIEKSGATIRTAEGNVFHVTDMWFVKHNPEVGGMITQCQQGFLSYCSIHAYNAIMECITFTGKT